VIHAAFTYSFYAAGLTLIALLQDTVFSAAPYNLTSSILLTNLPLFGAGLTGTLLASMSSVAYIGFAHFVRVEPPPSSLQLRYSLL
jgi:hypothetical protein